MRIACLDETSNVRRNEDESMDKSWSEAKAGSRNDSKCEIVDAGCIMDVMRIEDADPIDNACCGIPGRYESFWKELDYVKHLWKNRHELKVEDAGIAALFGLECYAWYCAGEIVGRGFTFTGYYV
ncbi:hypothetical protein ACLOJK_016839 [Asimina triloba]